MKKLLILLALCFTSSAFAKHHFTVCYYNWTDQPVRYDNDVMNPKGKWKIRGELVGEGEVEPKSNKCFTNIADETMIFKHSIIFSLNGKFYGIVNAPFSRPYAISNEADSSGDGRLIKQVIGGHENFHLNIHVTPTGTVLSESDNPNDIASRINPRPSK